MTVPLVQDVGGGDGKGRGRIFIEWHERPKLD